MHWDCHRSIDHNISYNRNVNQWCWQITRIFHLCLCVEWESRKIMIVSTLKKKKAYTGNLNVVLTLPLAILAGWQSDRKEQCSDGISWCNNNNNNKNKKAAYCRHSFGLGHLSITKIMY